MDRGEMGDTQREERNKDREKTDKAKRGRQSATGR